MSLKLTPQGNERVAEIAGRYGVSTDAAITLLSALMQSGGGMAQFNHYELGGNGQWMRGGMTMVGDMFNNGLKAKVDGLCSELSTLLPDSPSSIPGNFQSQSQGGGGATIFSQSSPQADERPEFGPAAWRGAQNDMRYAYYPNSRRLVVSVAGTVSVYDTGDHQLQGVSQQQQNGSATLSFTTSSGPVTEAMLRKVTEPITASPQAPRAESAPTRLAKAVTPDALPSSEDLTGTHWLDAAGVAITFAGDGSIAGSQPQKYAFWAVEDGALRLFAQDGLPTARFDKVTTDADGKVQSWSNSTNPSETLSSPVTAPTKASAEPSDGLVVLTIDLTKGQWDLINADGTVIAQLTLKKDGLIEGGRTVETRWRWDQNNLSLLHGSGRPTARFHTFSYKDNLWHLDGVFIGDVATACLLQQRG